MTAQVRTCWRAARACKREVPSKLMAGEPKRSREAGPAAVTNEAQRRRFIGIPLLLLVVASHRFCLVDWWSGVHSWKFHVLQYGGTTRPLALMHACSCSHVHAHARRRQKQRGGGSVSAALALAL